MLTAKITEWKNLNKIYHFSLADDDRQHPNLHIPSQKVLVIEAWTAPRNQEEPTELTHGSFFSFHFS